MVDVYSMIIPFQIIYPIGGIILLLIARSLLLDTVRAAPEVRKKLSKIYVCVFIGCIVLVGGLSYFNVSEKLFPSFYEYKERQGQLNEANAWEQNYNPEDWQRPFR